MSGRSMPNAWDGLPPERRAKLVENSRNYLDSLDLRKKFQYLESFCSCAIENNKLGGFYGHILRDYMDRKPVEDIKLVGLAFTIQKFEEDMAREKRD